MVVFWNNYEGVIKKKIQESDKEQELLIQEKKFWTNKYPNKNDRMKQDLELFPL
jgi:methylmalonyl-CoA mutase